MLLAGSENAGLLDSDSEDELDFLERQEETGASPGPSSMLSESQIRGLVDSQLQALAELLGAWLAHAHPAML